MTLALVALLSFGQVANLCGPGKVCSFSAARVGAGQNSILVGLTTGPFGSTLPGLKYDPAGLVLGFFNANNAVSFGINLGTGNVVTANPSVFSNSVTISGNTGLFWQPSTIVLNFATPSNPALSADVNTQTLWRGTSLLWNDVQSGSHPVLDRPTYVIDVSRGANTPEWHFQPKNIAGTGVSFSEGCVGGTLAAGATSTDFSGRTRSNRSRTTSALANSTCNGITAILNKWSNLRPRWSTSFRLGNNVTNYRFLCGLGTDNLFSGPADTPTQEGAWFRFSSSASDANLAFCTSDGVNAATCQSTGVAATASSVFSVAIDGRESGAVTAWVNGRPRLRVTTNIPSVTNDMVMGCSLQTLSAATREFSQSLQALEADL